MKVLRQQLDYLIVCLPLDGRSGYGYEEPVFLEAPHFILAGVWFHSY